MTSIDFDLEAEQIEDADILAELRVAQARTE